jgi:hypothetical protein
MRWMCLAALVAAACGGEEPAAKATSPSCSSLGAGWVHVNGADSEGKMLCVQSCRTDADCPEPVLCSDVPGAGEGMPSRMCQNAAVYMVQHTGELIFF